MALFIALKPKEYFIINGTLIRNGKKSGKLYIESHCRILRESESIKEENVNTPCKKIWMTLQVIHLAEEPGEAYAQLLLQIAAVTRNMPSSMPYISAILKALDEKHTHRALREVKALVQHEAELLSQQGLQAATA